MMLVGGIEAGGTKFVCAIGTGPNDIRAEVRFPTTTPTETIDQVVAFFRQHIPSHGPLAAIGIGAFGPVDVRPSSPKFGYFLNTPKPGWQHIEFASVSEIQFASAQFTYTTRPGCK